MSVKFWYSVSPSSMTRWINIEMTSSQCCVPTGSILFKTKMKDTCNGANNKTNNNSCSHPNRRVPEIRNRVESIYSSPTMMQYHDNTIFNVSLTLCCFVVYSTRRFVLCLSLCHFFLVFFSPFSIAITSLGEERSNLSAFRTFVRFVLVLDLSVFSSSWYLGRAAVCDCGTPGLYY